MEHLMNALEELDYIDWSTIKCASITYYEEYEESLELNLMVGYTSNDLLTFTTALSQINYDNGFGTQHLFGTIWLNYGTWMEREEYDGSEWWSHCECPSIPESLLPKP